MRPINRKFVVYHAFALSLLAAVACEHAGPASGGAFGPVIALATSEHCTAFYRRRTGLFREAELVCEQDNIKRLPVRFEDVHGLAFSVDGEQLAAVDAGGCIYLWEVSTATHLETECLSGSRGSAIIGIQGEQWVVTAVAQDDSSYVLLLDENLDVVRELFKNPGPFDGGGYLLSMARTADGGSFAIAANCAVLFEMPSQRQAGEVCPKGIAAEALAFSGLDDIVLLNTLGGVESGPLSLQLADELFVAIAPVGPGVLTATAGSKIYSLDRNLQSLAVTELPSSAGPLRALVSYGETRVVAGTGTGVVLILHYNRDGSLAIVRRYGY